MGMPAQHSDWTADMAIALPYDGKRYEVLDGELVVTPAPSWVHQTAVEELHVLLRPYVAEHRLGWVKLSPADIVLSPRRLVQPDVFVVPRGEAGRPSAWSDVRSLLLAIEVLSPRTAYIDRHRKRRMYQEFGVPEYWIVDAEACHVERWRPEGSAPEIVREALVWAPSAGVPPLTIDLSVFFATVNDDAS
jgi:Uma2 family endonuclease